MKELAFFGAIISLKNSPQSYKTFIMLNSSELEMFPAHKCKNVNSYWQFNIYEQDK